MILRQVLQMSAGVTRQTERCQITLTNSLTMCVVDVHDNGWLAVHQWWVGSFYPFSLRRVQGKHVLVPENSKSSEIDELMKQLDTLALVTAQPGIPVLGDGTLGLLEMQQLSRAPKHAEAGMKDRLSERGTQLFGACLLDLPAQPRARTLHWYYQDPIRGDSSPGPANTRNGRKRRPAPGDQFRDPWETKNKHKKWRQ